MADDVSDLIGAPDDGPKQLRDAIAAKAAERDRLRTRLATAYLHDAGFEPDRGIGAAVIRRAGDLDLTTPDATNRLVEDLSPQPTRTLTVIEGDSDDDD